MGASNNVKISYAALKAGSGGSTYISRQINEIGTFGNPEAALRIVSGVLSGSPLVRVEEGQTLPSFSNKCPGIQLHIQNPPSRAKKNKFVYFAEKPGDLVTLEEAKDLITLWGAISGDDPVSTIVKTQKEFLSGFIKVVARANRTIKKRKNFTDAKVLTHVLFVNKTEAFCAVCREDLVMEKVLGYQIFPENKYPPH